MRNPLEESYDHLFKDVPLKEVQPEDRIMFSPKDGTPLRPYVRIDDVVVPEQFLNAYQRTLRVHGPIFTPSTRFPEEFKDDPDSLLKFKACRLANILSVIYALHNWGYHSELGTRELESMGEILDTTEAMGCNVRWLRPELDYMKTHYHYLMLAKERALAKPRRLRTMEDYPDV